MDNKNTKLREAALVYRDYCYVRFYHDFLNDYETAIVLDNRLTKIINSYKDAPMDSELKHEKITQEVLDCIMDTTNRIERLDDFHNACMRIVYSDIAEAYVVGNFSMLGLAATSPERLFKTVQSTIENTAAAPATISATEIAQRESEEVAK